jgi:electron transfer flavoprotein beta subunit
VKIVVLLKKTPDTETKIKISSDQNSIEAGDTKFIMNPYDEFAIEEALLIKKKVGSGEVVIASFGEDNCREIIIKALAMGADRGLLISNKGLENADSLTTAKVLSAALKAEQAQIILCGKQAIDDDNMHVGTMVAELMNIPHVNVVTKLEINGETATAEREVEGGQVEVYDIKLPAVFGAHKSLNSPRYASLPGIMKAKKKPFDNKSPADYGLEIAPLADSMRTEILSYEYPPEKPSGQVFKDDAVDVMVDKVVNLLREEAKVL